MKHLHLAPRAQTVRIEATDTGLQLHLPENGMRAGGLTACRDVYYAQGALRTRPGWNTVESVDAAQGKVFVASGDHVHEGRCGRRLVEKYTDRNGNEVRRRLTVWQDGSIDSETTQVDAEAVQLMTDIGEHKVLVLENGKALVYTDGAEQGQSAPVYIPTVRIGGSGVESTDSTPAAPGTMLEEFNLLTPSWKETFTTDGKASYFFLIRRGVPAAIEAVYVGADGVEYRHKLEYGQKTETAERGDGLRLTYTEQLGAVGFSGYPDASKRPSASGFSGNLEITVIPEGGADARITGMTQSVWYGGERSGLAGGTRLFLSGNAQLPNLVHWSAVNRPDYFPENNYLYVGSADGAVTAMARQSDRLVVFKEREIYALQYHVGDISADAVEQGLSDGIEVQSAHFTLQPIHAGIGCIAPESAVLCAGRIIFLSADGQVCRLGSLAALSETNVQVLSQAVDPLLRQSTMAQRRQACACEYGGNYLLYLDGRILVLCGKDANFSAVSDGKAGWFIWSVPSGQRLLAMLGCGDKAVCIGIGGDGYLRQTHILDDSVSVRGSFQTGLMTPDGAPSRRCVERVWVDFDGKAPHFGLRTEWGAQPSRCSVAPCCPAVLVAQPGQAASFGIGAEGDGPWAIRRIYIRYRETGRMR